MIDNSLIIILGLWSLLIFLLYVVIWFVDFMVEDTKEMFKKDRQK